MGFTTVITWPGGDDGSDHRHHAERQFGQLQLLGHGQLRSSRNCPISYVTWGDAARFCNWLQNGQPTGSEGTGTTETGAYTLNGDTTNY